MSRTPLWTSIAEALTQDIETGRYGAGDKLPSEAALAKRFGVNRHTVRHALAALGEAGKVHARRGAGVFVTLLPAEYALGRRVRFQENILALGRMPSRQILRLETRLADALEADVLGLASGALVHVVEGLSFADAAPIALFRSVFPAAGMPDFLAAMEETSSVTASLAQCGVPDYTRHSTRISAISADALIALHLRLREGAAVLRTVAVNCDPSGRVVEYGTTYFAGDRVEVTLAGADLS